MKLEHITRICSKGKLMSPLSAGGVVRYFFALILPASVPAAFAEDSPVELPKISE